MTAESAALPLPQRSPLLPIVTGGLIAGTLDLLQASILFGWGVARVIAAGLLGREALHGGVGTFVLGLLLHYFIAITVTAIYYFAEHPLVCGLFYGIAVELVMSLIVLPLSALHASGPYTLHDLIQGLVAHMLMIGLPVAFTIRRFSK